MPFNDKGEWRPNRRQESLVIVPDTIKEAFYGGGKGSGKSEILLALPLLRKWHLHPRFKQVFLRRTFPELRNEIVPRSREFYPKLGATFNKSDMVWTFPRPEQVGGSDTQNSGAMIFLGHCENETDVYKYDSMEINLFTPDEVTSITEWIYLYIGFTRVRSSDPGKLPAIIRCAGTPGNIGHGWVKKRFVDPCKDGGKIIVGKGGNKRIFIFATLADNPYIDPAYKQGLEVLPEAEKNASLYGNWDAYLGQVFNEFRDKHYPDEPENAIHVVDPFDIPEWWPKFVVGDWGFRAMTYVGYFAVSPSKRLYLYREQYWKQTKIAEWAPYIKQLTDVENPRIVKFCKSAGQDRGQEQTIQEQISSELGIPIELSNNSPGSRIAGKILVHEYLRWKSKYVPIKEMPKYNEEFAQWTLRNKGLVAYKEYLRHFDLPEEESNLPKLQIFNTCQVMIDGIKACVYDKPKDNKPAEDVAEFDGDDSYDCLRYACDTAESYFVDAQDEFTKFKKREELSNLLVTQQDYTAFYRNMHRLEFEEGFKPLRMFSRRR